MRKFFDKFLKRKKPTLDEMGVAPAPSEPSPDETGLIEPGPAEPESGKWTEYDPAPIEPPVSEQATSTEIPESEQVVGYVERVLDALRKRDRTRRWLFVKFIAAWLVAYSLVTGEIPWFIQKIWHWANTMLAQGGWISSTPLN